MSDQPSNRNSVSKRDVARVWVADRREFWQQAREENLRRGFDPKAGRVLRGAPKVRIAPLALADYPRPANGSKRFEHWSALCWPAHAGFEKHLDTIAAMRCGGVKFLSDGNGRAGGVGDSGLGFAKAVIERGMVPVVRFYMDAAHLWTDANQYAVEAYVKAGVRYIETLNEPDLDYEWPDGHLPPDWVVRAFSTWILHARHIIAAGGIPLSPALASGFMQARGNTAGQLLINPFEMVRDAGIPYFACAIHNYALNHPIDYPSDPVNQRGHELTRTEWERLGAVAWDGQTIEQINAWRTSDANPGDTVKDDDSCFRACEIFRELLDEAGYTNVPIITTEGGPCLTDRQDRRYPRVTPVVMQEMIEAELAYMATLPWYFGYAWWLFGNPSIGGSGGWSTNQHFWPGGPWSDATGHIPMVGWLKERPLSADGAEAPEPEPEPEPIPEEEESMLKPTIWNVPEWNKLVLTEIAPQIEHWHATEIALLTDNDMNHTLYVRVLDAGGKPLPPGKWRVKVRNANGVVETLPEKTPPDLMNRPIWGADNLQVWIEDDQGHMSDLVTNIHGRYWAGVDGVPAGVNAKHLTYRVDFALGLVEAAIPEPEPEPTPEPGEPWLTVWAEGAYRLQKRTG